MRPEIAAAIDAISSLPRAHPPAIVFCDGSYVPILANWLAHARAAGVEDIVVVALDRAAFETTTARGVACVSLPPVVSQEHLWVRRAELFAGLAAAGIDFVHSDADAIWLRSPVDEIFGVDADIVFSPGTVWPPDVAAEWGFVLCCGLFGVRAGPAAAAFFAAALERMRLDRDDQIAVNRLLRDRGMIWRRRDPGEARRYGGQPFRVFRETVTGTCGNLTVGLLAHHRFPRLPEITEETIVAHPLSPKTAGGTIGELRRLGLWRHDDT